MLDVRAPSTESTQQGIVKLFEFPVGAAGDATKHKVHVVPLKFEQFFSFIFMVFKYTVFKSVRDSTGSQL